MKWQTIETAPKDGTAVLLWGGQCENDLGGRWDNKGIVYAVFQHGDPEYDDPDLWVELGGCYYSSWINNPTHWHPLPAPPEGT
jgi:hypothetical protein